MELRLTNIEPLEDMIWSPARINIIAGPNGTGKTYLTHQIYDVLKSASNRAVPSNAATFERIFQKISTAGQVHVPGDELIALLNEFVNQSLTLDSSLVRDYLAHHGAKNRLESEIRIRSANRDLTAQLTVRKTEQSENNPVFIWELVFFSEADQAQLPHEQTVDNSALIQQLLKFYISRLINLLIPAPSILTAERAGIAYFSPSIPPIRTEIPTDAVFTEDSDATAWPHAVRANCINFADLKNSFTKTGIIPTLAPEASTLFTELAGGSYSPSPASWNFQPTSTAATVPLNRASSTVRSLIELDGFINHTGGPGSTLIIDEPELNLHPSNQVKMARLLALLANLGVRVIVTTHSDYIVRELSILLLLHTKYHSTGELPAGYAPSMLLKATDIRLDYTTLNAAGSVSMHRADVSAQLGIEMPFFSSTIESQNQEFEHAFWGEL